MPGPSLRKGKGSSGTGLEVNDSVSGVTRVDLSAHLHSKKISKFLPSVAHLVYEELVVWNDALDELSMFCHDFSGVGLNSSWCEGCIIFLYIDLNKV